MIEVVNLSFSYPSRSPIFRGFNWRVERGENWAIIGSSGCGKTTLLYLLAGLRHPAAGRIVMEGELLDKPRSTIGLILQDYGLLPWATVLGNIELGLRLRKVSGSARKSVAQRWADELGIASHGRQYPAQLSGGQRQRVAIARTLALDPHILLMDEPFSSLDALTRESLQDLMVSLSSDTGLTTVLVTHNIEEAVFLGNKILVLGHPPIQSACTIENPLARTLDYRGNAAFHGKCDEVRRKVGEF
ncbi:MAG: ABC transporter ATP-binding protein [Dehalococcoidia bacterium]|nr:ABC transporter ATP-binding protein [Dehalococcoidia bacterium]